MSIYKQKLNISLIVLIIFFVLLAIGILGYLFFYGTTDNSKSNVLVGGLLAGLITAFAQLFQSWYEYKTIDKFKSMQIINILTHRDDRAFYERLISGANSNIAIMGVTAIRFIEHFADISSQRQESTVLLAAMTKGVKVRVLLPTENFLNEQKLKDNFRNANSSFLNIKNTYNQFEFKYFTHEPAHSIFIVDEQCILGPVFPGVSSKDTPAIHLYNTSPYASKYLQYFEQEWAIAT